MEPDRPGGPRPDPYRELGVPVGSDLRTIRKAYLAKARSHHPDLGGNPREMVRVNQAYELLNDPIRRAAYDSTATVRATRERQSAPWTGAAGPPPGRSSGHVLDFGIYAGWSLGEIARRDPGYLVWLSDRKESLPFHEELERYLEPLRQPPPLAHRRAGRR